MKRHYKFNPLSLNIGPREFINLAKIEYSKRFPSQGTPCRNPFAYCIMYLVINPDKTMRIDFKFPQDVPLKMKFFHKSPKGAEPGEPIRNVDFREVTDIQIPPYNGRFYFDFMFCVLDTNTGEYWATNWWTREVCPDLRYYFSKERKSQYKKVGLSLAQSYTLTFILGHVNLKTGKLRSSKGINKLIRYGWIPTIALLPQPYGEMVRIIESTNEMSQVNEFAVSIFNEHLLEAILLRWKKASLAQKRIDILATALERYQQGDFVSTVYVLVPQIEGLITEHIIRKRQSPEEHFKNRVNQFGDIINGEVFNTELTRYLTDLLIVNLNEVFYKTWFPAPRRGKRYRPSNLSPQRHVLSHGKVNPKYFTPENCLKLICVLDAIILLSLLKKEIPLGARAL